MKRFLGLAVVSASQILVTFFAQLAVIKLVGAGYRTDALFAAATLPQLLVSVLVVSASQVLITQLSQHEVADATRVAAGLCLLTGAAFVVVGALLAASSVVWLPLLFPRLHEVVGTLLILLSVVSLVGMIFQAMAMVAWSFHHSRGSHLFADGSRLASAILSLALVFVATSRWGVVGAAAAIAAGPLVHLLLMTRRMPLSLPDSRHIRLLRALASEAWPPIAGALYYKFDVLVDRVLSGLSGAGALSVYYLGHQMASASSQVLGSSIANPALPVISQRVAGRDAEGVRREIRSRIIWILLAGAGLLALFAVAAKPIIGILFGSSLSAGDVHLLYWLFICLSGLTLGGAVGQVTAGSFYAMGRSREPTLIGVVLYTLYIPLKLLAFAKGGLTGLALSVTCFYCASVFVQAGVLARRLRRLEPGDVAE